MKNYFIAFVILLSFFLNFKGFSQLYQGPATGSVPSGVTVSTDNFIGLYEPNPLPPTVQRPVRNKIPFEKYPDGMNNTPAAAPEGANYFTDPSAYNQTKTSDPEPVVLKSFQGFLDPGNYIPPDQYIAAGPTHIIAVDNSRFRIFDKKGKHIKTINIDYWFSSALGGVNAFDPKVSYDNFAKRWIMVWLHVDNNTSRSYFLISVSDDSIPLGFWNNWALPSNVNGSTFSNDWGDYQGVGFDTQAIYITANQFGFNAGFRGSKIRIINKSYLYSNTPGPVVWTDLWDIRDPANFSVRTFNVRPSIFLSPNIFNNDYYLLVHSPYQTGTFFTLYKISNPLTNPVMTGVNIPVTQYSAPTQAKQLGGGTPLIESGDVALRFEPIYKNGYIWCVHQIRSGTGGAYSSVRYLKFNTNTNEAVEDGAMGLDGYWHFYPSLMLDKDNNVVITYSRSGLTEYIGAFFTTRLNSMPPNTLTGSKLLQAGKANYVKTFGSGRNRWGDYNGIWVDPSDGNNIWMITQYAEQPVNTWACQIGLVRVIPLEGKHITTTVDSLNFGTIEVNFVSDTMRFSIRSLGSDTISISRLTFSNSQFILAGNYTFPIKLGYNQSFDFNLLFNPTSAGNYRDSVTVFSDAGNVGVILKGKSYKINPALAEKFYAITGSQSNGAFLMINDSTGAGTEIGLTGFFDIRSIAIRISDKIIFGCIPGSQQSKLVRINSQQGDAYFTYNLPIPNIVAIAFDLNNDLYCGTQDGKLYKYNITTSDTVYIGNTGISNLYGLAINPLNGELWAISLNNKIYKVNKTNGYVSFIGTPGFNLTSSIAFDYKGNLFGTSGLGTQISSLIRYDTTSGTATLVGSIGFKAVNSLAISYQEFTNVPLTYKLYQNYPNPFNPKTTIKIDLPISSKIELQIFDILGREIRKLASGFYQAGTYQFLWSAENETSGIYFCRFKTDSYTSYIKMVLVK
ncbi:MAG: T9SS type A sorting domain-containing protein [Ignavibacteria bacterium]|nr:T9SS type A sorting domain-containing protein [Ignavibacteria bacterium]